jgi:hypothetical protein
MYDAQTAQIALVLAMVPAALAFLVKLPFAGGPMGVRSAKVAGVGCLEAGLAFLVYPLSYGPLGVLTMPLMMTVLMFIPNALLLKRPGEDMSDVCRAPKGSRKALMMALAYPGLSCGFTFFFFAFIFQI